MNSTPAVSKVFFIIWIFGAVAFKNPGSVSILFIVLILTPEFCDSLSILQFNEALAIFIWLHEKVDNPDLMNYFRSYEPYRTITVEALHTPS